MEASRKQRNAKSAANTSAVQACRDADKGHMLMKSYEKKRNNLTAAESVLEGRIIELIEQHPALNLPTKKTKVFANHCARTPSMIASCFGGTKIDKDGHSTGQACASGLPIPDLDAITKTCKRNILQDEFNKLMRCFASVYMEEQGCTRVFLLCLCLSVAGIASSFFPAAFSAALMLGLAQHFLPCLHTLEAPVL